jgi:Fatty acid desaturase
MPSSQPTSGDLAVKPEYVSQSPAMAKPSEPNRNPKYDPKTVHITETPITRSNWYKHINWLNVTLIILIPLYGCIGAFWVPLHLKTAVWSVLYYFATALGITAGYHRLWAHTSYSATPPLRIFWAAVGGGAVEGSIRWWARDHRAHHRYTDTDKDPYSVRKGLLYAHLGWMIMKQNPKRIGRTDISDLNEDPVVVWQHKNYLNVVLFIEILAFSISHDHRSVRMYGHYATIEKMKTTFYRHPIREFSFTELEGKDKWTANKFTKSVYRIWMPTHFKRICSVIDALPADVNFELSQQSELHFSEQTGLSQDLANQNLSTFSTESRLSVHDDDSQLLPLDPLGTPDTSFTKGSAQGGTKKARKGRR